MIPALLLSIWAYEQNRQKYFVFGTVLAACTKDVGAAIVAIFGISLLLNRQWRYGGVHLNIRSYKLPVMLDHGMCQERDDIDALSRGPQDSHSPEKLNSGKRWQRILRMRWENNYSSLKV